MNATNLAAIAPSLPADGSGQGVPTYLASLSSGPSRTSMRSALDQVARILTGSDEVDASRVPWNRLRYEHMQALRSHLADAYAPATANKMLAAVRGVLRSAWRVGTMDTDDYSRAMDVKSVRGSRLPAGRALNAGEIRALFSVCSADRNPAGTRDAAAFAMLFGAGLRRSEAVSVHLDDYEPDSGTLTINGKGNRQRLVYATGGGKEAIEAWLADRGDWEGALLAPVNKGGQVQERPMTAQALMYRLQTRCAQAGIQPCSPHDLRRTFVSELLDAGADITSVQRLAGHQSPTTTARYDRRGERAKKKAAEMLVVPYRAPEQGVETANGSAKTPRLLPWPTNTPEHRWYGFGRYYAMFPSDYAYGAVCALTDPGERVIDPFCGRGNAPYTAAVLGRPSLGIDINPVAWLFSQVKLYPEPDVQRLLDRLEQIGKATRSQDRTSRSEFESMAWCGDVRGFLRAARRELDWKDSVTDRTLMGFITLHMQDKRGVGMSNQLPVTIASSPDYSISWWTKNGMTEPPEVAPTALLRAKIEWRYRYGTPQQVKASAALGDAREILRQTPPQQAGLLITSPPYYGVTDYWNDHWIRLWVLGHEMRKDWKHSDRHENLLKYRELIRGVFEAAAPHLKEDAAVLVRSDRRRKTADTCIEALRATWPGRRLLTRSSTAANPGISLMHGRGGSQAKELDLLQPVERGRLWWRAQGFKALR